MGEIGKRAAAAIREIAHKKDQTYTRAAMDIGISRQSMAQWENSEREPTSIAIQKLALAGCDIYWILLGRKENTL